MVIKVFVSALNSVVKALTLNVLEFTWRLIPRALLEGR
jgi:hypothetical protein